MKTRGPTDEWNSESRLARPPSDLFPTATSAGKPPERFEERSETKTDREASSFVPHSALAQTTRRLLTCSEK